VVEKKRSQTFLVREGVRSRGRKLRNIARIPHYRRFLVSRKELGRQADPAITGGRGIMKRAWKGLFAILK